MKKVTIEYIESLIRAQYFHILPSSTVTICKITLKNGYDVTGESACADPELFSVGDGRKYARENAINKIWSLEGYLLKQRMYDADQANRTPAPAPKFDNLSFGQAICALKNGHKLARSGWNGNGMWLKLIHAGNAMSDGYPMQDCIGMKTATGEMQPGWVASQTDVLADDWLII